MISLEEEKQINIVLTEKQYEGYCAVFDAMEAKAGEYVPTAETLRVKIIPNIQKYMPMLLWIEETGYDTESNRQVRSYIRNVIRDVLEIRS